MRGPTRAIASMRPYGPRSPARRWRGWGWAGYWLHDAELTLGSRQRASRASRGRGEVRGAGGGCAAWLAADFVEFRGEDAIASGWLGRAHRLLDDLPRCAEQGWLALIEGSIRLGAVGDLDEVGGVPRAMRRRFRAPARGGGCGSGGDRALAGRARARVPGAGARGQRRLDEASAIAPASSCSCRSRRAGRSVT